MKRYTWFVTVLVLSALVLAGCGAPALSLQSAAPLAASTSTPAPLAASSASSESIAALEGTLETIYTQVNPSVVNIQVELPASAATTTTIPDFPFPFGLPTPQAPQTQQALGSGFVWDNQGHIVTNNHVVSDADKITVTFYDGTIAPATLVGNDPDSDLAVIQVDVPAEELHPVQLADSTQVKVGELAATIGNPFGLEGSMSIGIVSALGRSLPVESTSTSSGPVYTIPDIIQTDAPINPGNSGGVLVNYQGQVIGVTAAIESTSGSNSGIGFAVPSTIVQKVVPSLIETGHFSHPYIGIGGTTLTPELATAMGLEANQRGALVGTVTPDSPADKAGLRGGDRQADIDGQSVPVGGDVIIAIDGQPVREFDDLITYLARYTQVGQTVSLTVLRNGSEQTVELTLAARPTQEATQSAQAGGTTSGARLGIVALTLTPDIAQAMDLPADQAGVLVEAVQQGSPADDAGLRGSYKTVTLNGQDLQVGGDIIIAIDDQPLVSMDELLGYLQQVEPGQSVTLTVLRDGQQVDVPVTLAGSSG